MTYAGEPCGLRQELNEHVWTVGGKVLGIYDFVRLNDSFH